MKTITDKKHIDRLKEKEIIIEDIFIKKNKKLIRKSDGSMLDQVYNASRIEKKYYYNNRCIFKEKNFPKNSNYTFATYNKDNNINCPNCGNKGTIEKFYDGCPYCDTEFNIDYGLKKYDIITFKKINDLKGFKLVVIVFAIILAIIMYLNSKNNEIGSLVLIILLPFSFLCSYIICSIFSIPIWIISSINSYKESKKIKSGEIDRSKIISSLNYELNQYYYNEPLYNDLIDFDIIHYYYLYDRLFNNQLYVDVKFKIRLYYFKVNKIQKKIIKKIVRLKYNDTEKNPSSHNIIECKNCGASVDISKRFCEYCNSKLPSINKWVIDKFW